MFVYVLGVGGEGYLFSFSRERVRGIVFVLELLGVVKGRIKDIFI